MLVSSSVSVSAERLPIIRVLIADEPTGNLDPITAMEIMEILDKINLRGTTILMVTHAKDIVDQMNKRVVAIEDDLLSAMSRGRIVLLAKNTITMRG